MNIDFFVIREGLKSIKPHHQAVGSKQRKGNNFLCNIQSKHKGYYYKIMRIPEIYTGSKSN